VLGALCRFCAAPTPLTCSTKKNWLNLGFRVRAGPSNSFLQRFNSIISDKKYGRGQAEGRGQELYTNFVEFQHNHNHQNTNQKERRGKAFLKYCRA